MDNLLKDTADLLDSIDRKLQEHADLLENSDEGGLWADFDDNFRTIRRNIRTYTLKIDEAIRWD